jgi:integrase
MADVRSHNQGSLFFRRRDRRWVASVTMNGKRPTHGCRHLDHRPAEKRPCDEARALLAELLRLRDARVAHADPRLTLTAYLQRWLADVRPNLAPATWRKHESIVRVHLIPALGHIRLSDLSVGDVRRLFVERPLGAQTLRHHRASLRRALADAVRDGLVTRNVAALAEPPKLPHRERPFLNAEQARILIEGTRDDRLGPLFHLAVTTGMREAELLGLAWKDVELGDARLEREAIHGPVANVQTSESEAVVGGASDRRQVLQGDAGRVGRQRRDDGHAYQAAVVHVRATLHRQDHEWVLAPPKTDKSRRTIPLTADCAAALRTHRTRQLEERVGSGGKYPAWGLVFTTERGQPMYDWMVLKALYAAEERLGLPRCGVHGLRHTATTLFMRAGYPPEKVAKILGHSTPRLVMELYSHLRQRDLDDAPGVMDRALGGGG